MLKQNKNKHNFNFNFIVDCVFENLPQNLKLPRKIVALFLIQKIKSEKIDLSKLNESQLILLSESIENSFKIASKMKEKETK